MPATCVKSSIELAPGLSSAVFRANADYRIVPLERLAPEHQQFFADAAADEQFFGILEPKCSNGRTIKAIDRDTALLLYTLREPGEVPLSLQRLLGARYHRVLTQLVTDSVVEIQDGTTFVTGADALYLLHPELKFVAAETPLSRLTLAAIRYGDQLEISDPAKLSARLYFYNRTPASRAWRSALADEAACARHVGFDSRHCAELLSRFWSDVSDLRLRSWRTFFNRSDPEPRSATADGVTYKLYISPACEELPRVMPEVLQVLTELRATAFKIGRTVYDLLRSDKLVVYFASREQLIYVAGRLDARLRGTAAQGVPFTAPLFNDCLLSWGVDPARRRRVVPWLQDDSWRINITNIVARELLAAKATHSSSCAPWERALRRLHALNLDMETWT